MRKELCSRFVFLLVCALLLGLLTGCGGKDKDDAQAPSQDAQTTAPPSTQPEPTGVPDVPGFGLEGEMGGDGVDFNLQSPGNPDFDNVPVGSFDTGLYVTEGDYAYALDPATLDKVGPPLDPVTHEPVQTEAPPPDENAPEETPPETKPEETAPPAEEVKLPNTGLFLEDD